MTKNKALSLLIDYAKIHKQEPDTNVIVAVENNIEWSYCKLEMFVYRHRNKTRLNKEE